VGCCLLLAPLQFPLFLDAIDLVDFFLVWVKVRFCVGKGGLVMGLVVK
jgi:hypothetical protein